jgi:hypothetical protein
MQKSFLTVTFIFVLLRGYLYFSEQQLIAAILDLALLPLYAFACVKDRRAIYIGLVAYLPASSVFYLPTGVIPFDLSLLVVLMSITLLSRNVPVRRYSNAIHFALLYFGALCFYLFINIAIDSLSDSREIREQIKVLYLLGTAGAAGFLFNKIYETRDSSHILAAIELGLFAYVVAGCLGYLYPLSNYTWQLESGFQFKTLFRYPGMSNSNYVAHVLLVFLAIHKLLATRSRTSSHPLFYVGVITIIAVVSQSRSFVITAAILLVSTWAIRILRLGNGNPSKTESRSRLRTNVGIAMVAIVALVMFSEFFLGLAQQTVDRFGASDRSTVNISRRLDEWRETFAHFDRTDRSMIRGNISYPENLRPHNVVLASVLVFGVPIALVVSFLFVALVLKFPILLFMIIGAQAEILFVTGIYDFLFLMILTILCSRQNWMNEQLLALDLSAKKDFNAGVT